MATDMLGVNVGVGDMVVNSWNGRMIVGCVTEHSDAVLFLSELAPDMTFPSRQEVLCSGSLKVEFPVYLGDSDPFCADPLGSPVFPGDTIVYIKFAPAQATTGTLSGLQIGVVKDVSYHSGKVSVQPVSTGPQKGFPQPSDSVLKSRQIVVVSAIPGLEQ